jgi:adenylylsulfate kinase
MIIQLCGLSGAGKTTLAHLAKAKLSQTNIPVEIIDGDEYRKTLCKDLGFAMADRCENIRRLAFVASKLSQHNVVAIISAINPYQKIRDEVNCIYKNTYLVHVHCPLDMLFERDTKGLYRRALLPDDHPDKIVGLTGLSGDFDVPERPDLLIDTSRETAESAVQRLTALITENYKVTSTRPSRMLTNA